MTPEERALLEKTYALAKENHEMLEYLRRAERTKRIFRILYWVLFIVLTVGSYYATVKFVDYFTGAAGILRDASDAAVQPSSLEGVRTLIEQLGPGMQYLK